MEKDPLLPSYTNPRTTRPPPLCPLPEEDEITLTLPLTPTELKDLLIFGPSSSPHDSSPIFDAITLSLSSPKKPSSASPSSSCSQQPISPFHLLDPDLPWTKYNLHRSKTAPAMAVINEVIPHNLTPPPQFDDQSIVRQACVFLFIYLSLGVIIYWFNSHNFSAIEKTNPIVDALYFCIVTMCTIGYGDITPNSTSTKLFSILFVLVGFGFIDILLTGMVGYMLDLQESYLLRNVTNKDRKESSSSSSSSKKRSYIIDVKKGRMRIRMKVGLALVVVVICIGVGACVMHFMERLEWLDSVYLSVMSVTTVGYGDRAFTSMSGRIFALVWLLVSTLAVARAFLYLAEARVDKRNRKMAKWILGQDMTVSEFLAADIDNNGFVSKSEYAIYKLKEMGKISEKDILQICSTFDRLDAGNCGKITLANLLENHH